LHSLSGEKILDDAEDPLLLMPGKLADFFKNAESVDTHCLF
jgi:hypothetical protein